MAAQVKNEHEEADFLRDIIKYVYVSLCQSDEIPVIVLKDLREKLRSGIEESTR